MKLVGFLGTLAALGFSTVYVCGFVECPGFPTPPRLRPAIDTVSLVKVAAGQEFDVTGVNLAKVDKVQLRKVLKVEPLFMMPRSETAMLLAVPSGADPAVEYTLEIRGRGNKEFVSTTHKLTIAPREQNGLLLDGKKPPIVFANLNWDTARMQNAIARFIVENGYGYPTGSIPDLPGKAEDVFKSLVTGSINVYLEVWLPNLREEWETALESGSVIPLGKSLDVTWQSGFVVPTYMVDGNPDTGNPNTQAPGLVTVQDLKNHTEVFAKRGSGGKAVLWNCPPIWGCAKINEGQVQSYGLSDVIDLRNPGSQEELENKVLLATEDGLAWLGYMWSPTKVESSVNLTSLVEPSCNVGQNPEDGCGYDDSRVRIAVHPSLVANAADLVEMFRKWDFKESTLFVAETCIEETGEDF